MGKKEGRGGSWGVLYAVRLAYWWTGYSGQMQQNSRNDKKLFTPLLLWQEVIHCSAVMEKQQLPTEDFLLLRLTLVLGLGYNPIANTNNIDNTQTNVVMHFYVFAKKCCFKSTLYKAHCMKQMEPTMRHVAASLQTEGLCC